MYVFKEFDLRKADGFTYNVCELDTLLNFFWFWISSNLHSIKLVCLEHFCFCYFTDIVLDEPKIRDG